MIDDPLSILSLFVWIAAAGMYPLGFLFGACSPCCDRECPWILSFDRCMRVSFVDSDPPVGGDCRLAMSHARSGDIEYMTSNYLQIQNVQSRIRVTVRMRLLADGDGRTAVGETRTQVWRFNRAAPSIPDATAYDVLGPEWHLQVDLSVTGVETQAEAGVDASIGYDSEGQPKLVLQVHQWTSDITHDEVVTLFPVGLQRWGGYPGVETFRLSQNSLSATLVSGGAVSGWSLVKLPGLVIEERQLAVRVGGTGVAMEGNFCTAAGGERITAAAQRIILNAETAVSFLNGSDDLRITLPQGQRDVRIMPDNVLCELLFDQTGVGVAAGIYPEVVYATPSQFFVNAIKCDRSPYVMRYAADIGSVPFLSNSGTWKSSWNYRGGGRSEFGWITVRAHEFFYSGKSLLWNAEHGPYRTTGPGVGPATGLPGFISDLGSDFDDFYPGWACHLDGEGDEFFNNPDEGVCPDGMVLGGGLTHETANRPGFGPGNRYNVCTPASIEVHATYETRLFGFQVSGEMQGTLTRAADEFYSGIFLLNSGINFSGNLVGEEHEIDIPGLGPYLIRPSATAVLAEVPCEFTGNLTVVGAVGVDSLSLTTSIPFASRSRPSCGDWTTAPGDGGTITRTCENLEGYLPAGAGNPVVPVSESIAVPPRNSRVPMHHGYEIGSPDKVPGSTGGRRGFYGPGPTQLGWCELLGVSFLRDTQRRLAPATQLVSTAVSGECFSFLPVFGADFPDPMNTNLSAKTTLPCDNCTPSVEIVAGSDNAIVRYITDGGKAGIIEVVAKRTWLGAQGVTFSISCGNDTITQTLRRFDTAPLAPQNLTVTRGPCGEALLQWQAPEWDGGRPVTAYNIEFRRIGGVFAAFGSVAAPALSATVTGLLRLGYEFRVSATNGVGTGEFSNVAVDGFALGPPTELTAAPRDPCDQVTLSWTPPKQSECVVVKEYRVQAFFVPGEPVIDIPVPGDVTTYTVTGLSPTVTRQFRIRRDDDAGTFLWSQVVTSEGCPPE